MVLVRGTRLESSGAITVAGGRVRGAATQVEFVATSVEKRPPVLLGLVGCGDRTDQSQLRHTAIATANDRTGDLRAAQEFARHARPETTAIYTRATAKRLWEALLALDYLG